MKRIWLWILVWAVAAAGLAGCSGDDPGSKEATSDAIDQQVIQAMELEWDGDWEGSMCALEALVADYPDHAKLRVLLGRSYDFMSIKANVDAGNNTAGRVYDAKALEQYREAVDLDPDLAEARIRLASSLSTMDENQTAKEHLAYVLEQDPDNRDAHWHMGLIFWGEKQLPEARIHFQASLGQDLDPNLAGQERTFPYDRASGYATTSGHRRAAHVELRYAIDDPVLYQAILSRPEREEDYLSAALIMAVSWALKDLPEQPEQDEIERAEQEALALLHKWDNLPNVGLRAVDLTITQVDMLP